VVCAVICEPVSPVSTLFSPVLPCSAVKNGQFPGIGAQFAANHLHHISF
jgi:hypothetical protein